MHIVVGMVHSSKLVPPPMGNPGSATVQDSYFSLVLYTQNLKETSK